MTVSKKKNFSKLNLVAMLTGKNPKFGPKTDFTPALASQNLFEQSLSNFQQRFYKGNKMS
jgi:hypothetical protein